MFDRDLFGEPVLNGHKSVLAQTFDYPPFSVMNAREGWWQERKRQWLALGIKSEVGRGGGLTMDSAEVTTEGLNYYRNRAGGVSPAPLHSTSATGSQLGSGTTAND